MKNEEKTAKIDQLDDGAWLRESLAADAKDVGRHPTPEAIGRMRGRVMSHLKRPTKAAA